MTDSQPSGDDSQPSEDARRTEDLATNAKDYADTYYRSGLGPPYEESEPHWATFFGGVASEIITLLSPSTVLDVGCAKGFLVDAFVKQGIDAFGVDISDYAIAAASERIRDRVSVHDLTKPLTGRWDLISCIEVVEHMAPGDAQQAIDNMTAATDLVLFSSTPLDFTEATHVNVHTAADWATFFARRGFFRRPGFDASFLSPWAVLFERRSLSVGDVTYLYETELAPLRQEVVEKRQALLERQRRLDEIMSNRPALGGQDTERLLGLIDQVIGLEAELAETKHKLSRFDNDLVKLAAPEVRGGHVSKEVYEALAAQCASEVELRHTLQRDLHEARKQAEDLDEARAKLAALTTSRAGRLAFFLSSLAAQLKRLSPRRR